MGVRGFYYINMHCNNQKMNQTQIKVVYEMQRFDGKFWRMDDQDDRAQNRWSEEDDLIKLL